MNDRSRLLTALTVLSALAAVDASAQDIPRVENPALETADLPVRSLPEPSVVVGVVSGAPEYELYGATYALRLDDGRIVLANTGTDELRFFGPDGRHLRSVGREGGGPGEFRAIRGLTRLPGDSLGVWDWDLRRLTIYDDAGTFGRVVTPGGLAGFVPRLIGAFDDGTLVGTGGQDPRAAAAAAVNAGGEVREDTVALLRLDPGAGATLDTVVRLPGRQHRLVARGESFSMQAVLLGRQEQLDMGADRLMVGDDRTGGIRVFGPDGRLRRRIRTGPGPRAVADRDVEWLVRQFLARLPEEEWPGARANLRQLPVAVTVPAFTGLFADRLGRLWLAHHDIDDDPVRRWTVLNAEGRYLAHVDLPQQARPLDAGSDYLLAHLRDELDVEHVVLYHLP